MKRVVMSLAAVSMILVFVGCPKKPQPQPPKPPELTDTAPPPPPPPVKVETRADDFEQKPPAVAEDDLSAKSVAELNQMARDKGWIADAFFAYDSNTLSADARDALERSARWLRDHPDLGLTIEGHCDDRGTEQYNLALGDRRAFTAREYLETLGVDGSRLTTVSYGEERPFREGADEEAWSQNRRAHLVLRRLQ